ncbi:lipid-binding SYLF domain-containing protein [Lysobacter soyae]|jgi:lipid-binding SYLF domain-containing protein|uniref:Lipid-binding SYLF domain-containing protein n=1 Tax=Lysobacter soyae TaxID=2764185 RepID=A0ABX8WMY6_9GAMM|nr:lipid-binding SYLF domain-containing protein [Lysobacter sp. CJ11]QYR52980.1 lipid-binding SYLF domain-containing protein [Lysobacter sp. CJ11]
MDFRAATPAFRWLLPTLLVAGGLAASSGAQAKDKLDDAARAQRAVQVLRDIQAIPESAIPDRLFDEARAVVVVPDTLKIGFIFGGRRGEGLLSVRRPDGSWSAPSFVKLTGGSIGLQAGVQSADIVMVFHTDRGLDSIVAGKFTLGADAGVAAGPVGRTASASTDEQLKAEIWSWSRARGLFAGVSVDGAALSIDDAANQRMYGQGSTPRMIFEGRTAVRTPNALVDFSDTIEEAAAAAHSRRAVSDAPVAASATPTVAPAATAAPVAAPETQTAAPAASSAVTTEALPEPAKKP